MVDDFGNLLLMMFGGCLVLVVWFVSCLFEIGLVF